MLHLSYLDHARHGHGGFSPEAKAALLSCDERFGRIVRQLKRLGLYEETDFAVWAITAICGEAGLSPNVILRERGLIELAEDGKRQKLEGLLPLGGLILPCGPARSGGRKSPQPGPGDFK